jgi:DNA repair protein NreA
MDTRPQDRRNAGSASASPVDSLCPSCRKSGRVFCPHKPTLAIAAELRQSIKQDVFGPTPPNVFVGHNFYPNLYWGPMVSAVHGEVKDSPADWYGMDFAQIIRQRSLLIRGQSRMDARSVPTDGTRLLSETQDAVMSVKQVDVEAHFSKLPQFRMDLDAVHAPMGASAPIDRLKLAENPSIPGKVDELVNERILARQAIAELQSSGFDNYYLTKLISAGLLGRSENRKLVPTKWSITAIDDMLAKSLMEKIRDLQPLQSYLVFENQYLYNHFVILLMPGAWEYEQFEAWSTSTAGAHSAGSANANVSEEYEPHEGRKDYAARQGGGYYASRLPICEYLEAQNKQARVVVLREILPEYEMPVGVWEVRENVRHAMQNPPAKFESQQDAMNHAFSKLSVPRNKYLALSRILRQKRLTDF